MVALDATMLVLLVNPNAPGPKDDNGKPLPYALERVNNLVRELEQTRTVIVVPAPALSEVLIKLTPSQMHNAITILNQSSVFRIEPFDQRAAIELAEMVKQESSETRKKVRQGGAETYAKLKFDRQIVAIAKVAGVTRLYSDDDGVYALGRRAGLDVQRARDIPIPETERQLDLLKHQPPQP